MAYKRGAQDLAAVHHDGLAGDPARERGGQEQDRIGDLVGSPMAPEGNAADDPVIERPVLLLDDVPIAARRLDGTRRHAVHPDALAGERRRLAGRVLDQRRLGGGIGLVGGCGLQARDRRDVDDRPTAGFGHHRHRRARGPCGCHEIDGETGRPIGFLLAVAITRGVVDQDVDAAQRRGRLADIAGDGGAIGEIAARGMDLAAEPGELGAGIGQPLLAASTDGHIRAGLGELAGDLAPDAAASAGDDRALALEIERHARFSPA